MSKFVRTGLSLSTLCLLLVGFQNCGKMSSASLPDTSGSSSATGPDASVGTPDGPVSTPEEFISMRPGGIYDLANDIALSDRVLNREFNSVTLRGHGHTVSGIRAECLSSTECRINSGRDFYVSALSFENCDLSDISFSLVGDVAKFPETNDDITAINFVDFSNTRGSNIQLIERVTGVHPHKSGDNRFFVNGFSASGGSIAGLRVDLQTDVTLPSEMFIGASAVGSVWGATVKGLRSKSQFIWRPKTAGTRFYLHSISSLNAGRIEDSEIDDVISIQSGGLDFDFDFTASSATNGSFVLNSKLKTVSNVAPDSRVLLPEVDQSFGPFDRTGSTHSYNVAP